MVSSPNSCDSSEVENLINNIHRTMDSEKECREDGGGSNGVQKGVETKASGK
jgi:hypothetical protein